MSRIIIHYKIMREMHWQCLNFNLYDLLIYYNAKISLYLNSTWAHLSYCRTLKLISYGRAASPLLLRLHALRASPMVKHVFGAGVQCLIIHLHFHRWIHQWKEKVRTKEMIDTHYIVAWETGDFFSSFPCWSRTSKSFFFGWFMVKPNQECYRTGPNSILRTERARINVLLDLNMMTTPRHDIW